jgi:hypothetical protein
MCNGNVGSELIVLPSHLVVHLIVTALVLFMVYGLCCLLVIDADREWNSRIVVGRVMLRCVMVMLGSS